MTRLATKHSTAASAAVMTLQATQRVRQARIEMLLTQPFLSWLVMKLKPVARVNPHDEVVTDGTHLFFDPVRIRDLSQSRLVACIAAAALKCGNGHPWRQGDRDPARWNRASALSVNYLLQRDGFDIDPAWPQDPAFNDMAAEVVYSRLPAEMPPQDGDQPDEGDDGEGEGASQAFQMAAGDEGEDGEGEGQGESPSEAPTGSDEGSDEGGEGPQAGDRPSYGAGVEKPQPAPDGSESPAEAAERLEAEWEQTVKYAAQAALAQGHSPASMRSAVGDKERPRGDWRNELRHLMASQSRDDYSWKMPAARYLARGLYMPALNDERMECAVFVRDTSGSVSDDTLAKANAEIFAAIDEVKPRRTIIIDCDAMVQKVWELNEGDTPPDLIQAHGRGGTSFVPPFKWLEQQGIEPSVLIYLTDLEGTFPQQPQFETVWVACTRHTAPFGRTLHIL